MNNAVCKDNEVPVDKDEYEELLEDRKFLDALRAAGVDNWEGYSDAHEFLE